MIPLLSKVGVELIPVTIGKYFSMITSKLCHVTFLMALGFLGDGHEQVMGFTAGSGSLWRREAPSTATMCPTHALPYVQRRSSSASLNMALDRMSNDCIGGIMTSHKVSNALGMEVLTREMMLVGIVGKPEKSETTLAKYGITFEAVRDAAENYLRTSKKQSIVNDGGNEDQNPLPFSNESKQTLQDALKIAEYFASTKIGSEHVLLALMEYNYGNLIDIEGTTVSGNPIVKILLETEGTSIDQNKFNPYDFCEDLIYEMKRSPTKTTEEEGEPKSVVLKEERVVIGGSDPGGATSTLDSVGVDLTQMAAEGKLDVVYGRNEEIKMALRTLGRRRKNNPCIIGDPGVGKTAIAEAIAQVIASSYETTTTTTTTNVAKGRFSFPNLKNPFRKDKTKEGDKDTTVIEEADFSLYPECPDSLKGFRVVSLELASLVAGTRNRGDFEEKVQKIIKEVEQSNVILFIDEIHNLIGTGGGGDGAMNAANLMKPALARGNLRVLGSTTTPEYRRYIEKDAALERRFQPLMVKEPTLFETMPILGAVVSNYEEFHGVTYTMNALLAAAKLSDRYITDRFLPDKAIDLMDEAGSMTKMNASPDDEDLIVTEDTIAQVVSEITRIPVGKLETGEKERLKNLESEMQKRIKGQERAVNAVCKAIRRSRSGLRDGKRPVASFFFCGPTGVGKTEVCKALASTYFGQESDMIRLDMSEYMDRFSTSRLIGAPPGYVGYEEGGQLTEAVRRSPHSVILLDELEKAHEDVLNILLQVLDEGQLTDGKGRTISFRNTVLVMTSNVGSEEILNVAKTSTSSGVLQSLEMAIVVKQKLEETMKPELLNRMDEIVVFSPLSDKHLREICVNILQETVERAATDLNLGITLTPEFIDTVTNESLEASALYGARPIRKAAQRFLLDTLSTAIIDDFVFEGDNVEVDIFESESDENEAQQRPVVSICKNGDDENCMQITVDDDAGIGSTDFSTNIEEGQDNMEWAAYSPLPGEEKDKKKDKSENPKTEPDESSWG